MIESTAGMMKMAPQSENPTAMRVETPKLLDDGEIGEA